MKFHTGLHSLLFALAIPALVCADDWPVFRGPNGNGISTESGWAVSQGRSPVVWKAPVGLGYSAATVSGGRVFITGHDGKKSDEIYCLDESTGKTIWVKHYPQNIGALYFQGGTTGTVTADGDRIYHLAREGDLFCRDAATGEVIWKTHLKKNLGYSKPDWGFTGAPLVHGGRLYVTAGEAGLALHKNNGAVIWKSKDAECGYSTPYLFSRDGKELMIFSNEKNYVCVDAETGNKLWNLRWMTRYGVNAADPIVDGDYVFISSGYGKGAVLLMWDGQGDPTEVWKSRDMKNQMNASILVDGYLYGIDGNEGQDGTSLKCMEMLTGKTMWSDTSVGHGTVCVANGNLIVLTEQGELQIAPLSSSDYEPLFRQKAVSPKVWTVPVLANGRVYCRNAAGELTVIDLRTSS